MGPTPQISFPVFDGEIKICSCISAIPLKSRNVWARKVDNRIIVRAIMFQSSFNLNGLPGCQPRSKIVRSGHHHY